MTGNGSSDGDGGNGDVNTPSQNGGGGGNAAQAGQGNGGARVTPPADSTKSGMSADTRLIVGLVLGTVVATGIVVAVVVGTVLGSQILHNGTEIRNLATRIDDERDDLFARVHTEIHTLISRLAAGGDAGLADEMRQDHRRLEDRMHNIERELSDVDQSVEGLDRSDAAATHPLNERMRDIQNELEEMNRNLQNLDRSDAATHPLNERMRDIQNALKEVNRNLETLRLAPQ